MSNFRDITNEWYSCANQIIKVIDKEFYYWNDEKSKEFKSQFDDQKGLIQGELKGKAEMLSVRILELRNQCKVVEELIKNMRI